MYIYNIIYIYIYIYYNNPTEWGFPNWGHEPQPRGPFWMILQVEPALETALRAFCEPRSEPRSRRSRGSTNIHG